MKKIITKIPGLYIIENDFIFQDERGVFLESWNKKYFEKINLSSNWLIRRQTIQWRSLCLNLLKESQ